jgi:hypothetical protein
LFNVPNNPPFLPRSPTALYRTAPNLCISEFGVYVGVFAAVEPGGRLANGFDNLLGKAGSVSSTVCPL